MDSLRTLQRTAGEAGHAAVSRRGFLRSTTGAGIAAGTVSLFGASPRVVVAGAQEPAPSPSLAAGDAGFGLLAEQVQMAMRRHGVPGAAVGIFVRGREYLAGFGVTNVESPRPVQDDTLFQVGSLAKLATSMTAMRLVAQGSLDMDAPVRDYLPDLTLADAGAAARVTLAHLISHTSGWVGDFFPDTGRGDDALARYVGGMATLPQVSPPGRYLSYDNAGYVLAGRVIEVVTRKSYEAAVRDLIFTPLAMQRSTFFAEEAITYTVAAGHSQTASGPRVVRPWGQPRGANPAGGLISSAREQLAFARFGLGDGTAADGTGLLRPETMARMLTPLGPGGIADGGERESVGVGWLLRSANGVCIAEKGGGGQGQRSWICIVPAHQFALVLLTNAEAGRALLPEVVAWTLDHYLGLTEPAIVPEERSRERLLPYAGTYEYPGQYAVELEVGEGVLPARLIAPDGSIEEAGTFRFYRDDHVVGGDVGRADFVRADDGTLFGVRIGGRLLVRRP